MMRIAFIRFLLGAVAGILGMYALRLVALG